MDKSDSALANKSHFTWMDKSAVRCQTGSGCRWSLAELLMSRGWEIGTKKAENIHKITQGVVPMSIWTNHKPKILNGLEDSLVKVWVGRDWLTQTFTPGGGPLPPHVPPTIIPSYPVSSPHHQVAHKKCSNALQPQLCRNNSCCISL